mmetsp:Transcript_15269/g.25375  ORF Transcript_15269/g.25375 Transcript_15269/m.25375 type:complete len:590 (-) Transcript_15269:49-1818(-)|eukprot:CAMPEP_0114422368 /NCGR_PEP_ID=MMETSP0103-20121206/5571_1 /TAXON_ID=37642 ORGANISM="Paraphysomonas imperforata, Strain PA2" /NCGR_SAMPLE_ID=MMETSP0103 /ASSEMBLY_ACC=CAM_ASM_000201 /LENGTH=589 /DNA_ID=CAMNT_0001590945 /DNA_START=51 /DNA_END=1820 /DNA_ORIENTATION=-
MKCIAVLTALLSFIGANGYSFSTNTSAHQRLDLHEKHSSFGHVVAVQDVIAVVSAPHYSFNEFLEPDGIIYVYRYDNSYWTLIRGITDLEYADQFGLSMALHTDYFAVIGAPNSNKYGKRSGCVYYVYVESNPYKHQSDVVQVVQSERHEGAGFGTSVAVGTVLGEVTVAVGAPNHRGRGAVFIYKRMVDGTLSNEEILYTSDDGASRDVAALALGAGVQVGYNMVLGGCPGGKRGYVYVFQRVGGQSFSESAVLSGVSGYEDDKDDDGYLENENYAKQIEEFGETIAVGNGYIFVGAPYAYTASDHSTTYGSVTIFKYATAIDGTASSFLLDQTLTANHLPQSGANSFFGTSLSYDNNEKRLVVGSPYGRYPSVELGYVTLYTYDSYGNTFEQEAVLNVNSFMPEENTGNMQNYGETAQAGFGTSVSMSGGFVLVGAPQGASQYGDAYFFAAPGAGEEDAVSFLEMFSNHLFTSVGLVLFPIAIIGLVVLVLLWRKFRDSNYDDSFSQFILDEVSEFFGRVGSESMSSVESCTSLQFMGEDDSAHSTHPMIVGTSVPTKKKTKKGKSSKFKSKTGVGNYESANFDDNL